MELCDKPSRKEGIDAALKTDRPASAKRLKLKICPLIICDNAEKEASDKVKATIPNQSVAPSMACQTGKKEKSDTAKPSKARVNPIISGVALRVAA